nr:efflux RND transporter periplasmic adaptor subunit [Pedobacter sp. ASV19]
MTTKIFNYVLIVGALLLSACSEKKAKEATKEEPKQGNTVSLTADQLKNTPVTLAVLEEKPISSVVKVNGKIDVPPQNLVSVSAPLGGFLKSTRLLPGMFIKKGEVIATLEDQQYVQLQQDYLLAKSKLHFSELEFARQKDLNQSKASSDKVTQQAQSERDYQRILVNSLAEKLRLININPQGLSADKISKSIFLYASINGFVSKVNVNPGKYINPADVLFELVDPSDIHLNLKVYQNDVAKLAIGQKLVAYNNVHPEKKYNAQIILISKDISAEGITEVHCHFKTEDKTLLPGMYMNAEIEVNGVMSPVLPAEAVVHFEGKDYVFVAGLSQHFTMEPVQTGAGEKGYITVINAKNFEGKQIVVKGAYALLMKLKNTEE